MNNIICRVRCAHAYLKIGVAMLLLATSSACEKNGFTYDLTGSNQPSSYIVADTLTINMNTVSLDSIPTNGTGVMLCGRHQDPYLGKITAAAFFQLQLPSSTVTSAMQADLSSRYDSVELILKPNRQVYGDTLAMQEIGVYEVLQTIQKAENSAYLYNNSNFQTAAQPLASVQQVVRPSSDSSIHIKLPNSYGNTLFNLFKNKNNEVSTQDIFLQYYRGLAIKPGASSANIMGFLTSDTSVILRLHYHVNEVIITDRHLDMNLYNPDVQFNQISADRTGTLLAGLTGTTKSLPSTATNNMSFVQPLTGILTRIDLPSLKTLASVGKFFKVMRATLTLLPVAGTYQNYYTLPPAVTLCETDDKNNVIDTLVASTGGVQHGNLVIDNLYQLNTTYTYDITHYAINNINSNGYNNYGLLVMPSRGAATTSFNRLVLGDSKNKQNKIRIQVYYLLYN